MFFRRDVSGKKVRGSVFQTDEREERRWPVCQTDEQEGNVICAREGVGDEMDACPGRIVRINIAKWARYGERGWDLFFAWVVEGAKGGWKSSVGLRAWSDEALEVGCWAGVGGIFV